LTCFSNANTTTENTATIIIIIIIIIILRGIDEGEMTTPKARKTKIPKHHLTSVLEKSRRVGCNEPLILSDTEDEG
jgi:hypothetical protein